MINYKNKYGELEVENVSVELLVNEMCYNSAPDCSKFNLDDLERISIISDGAISTCINYPPSYPNYPLEGFIFVYTSRNTAKYLKVLKLEWNENYDSIVASEQLAKKRTSHYAM